MAAQGEIPVYGKFVNETTNHVLAGTDQIKDDTQNKMQSTINSETQGSLTRIEKLAKAALVL